MKERIIEKIYKAIIFTLLMEILVIGVGNLLDFSLWVVFGYPMFDFFDIKILELYVIVIGSLSFIYGLIIY